MLPESIVPTLAPASVVSDPPAGKDREKTVRVTVEEACSVGLHHSGFSCGNHQLKVFFEIPDVSTATTTDEGSSKLPKRMVFQRKSLVGDFCKRALSKSHFIKHLGQLSTLHACNQ